MINSSIFKSYDVRGIYPSDLNEESAYLIGRAFISYSGAKKVVVGYDARLSSPELLKAFAAGVLAEGAQITTIGQMPTECLYFALAMGDFDGGVMITASHNPKEYNGFKMLTKKDGDIAVIRGKDLLSSVKEYPFDGGTTQEIPEKDILQEYKEYLFDKFDFSGVGKFKIVVDASNGVMGNVLSKIKAELPVEMIELNFQPDGNFPNHSPNPLEEGSSDQIKKAIAQHNADFGIMFDGDADRIFLVDEQGSLIKGDIAISFLAKQLLSQHPGAAIAYNAICSKAVSELITQWQGVPVRTPVGFVNVREGLMKHHGIMGGEVSAHYCFKDYFYMDSGMMAFLIFLQVISEDGRPVSEIAKELSPYPKAEINLTVPDKDAILAALKEKYADGRQDFMDGITVEYDDWWFNARGSNTEPLLRLTIEADNEKILAEKVGELQKIIQ